MFDDEVPYDVEFCYKEGFALGLWTNCSAFAAYLLPCWWEKRLEALSKVHEECSAPHEHDSTGATVASPVDVLACTARHTRL